MIYAMTSEDGQCSGGMIWSDVGAPARTQAQELRSLDLGQLVARLWPWRGQQSAARGGRIQINITKCVNPRPE